MEKPVQVAFVRRSSEERFFTLFKGKRADTCIGVEGGSGCSVESCSPQGRSVSSDPPLLQDRDDRALLVGLVAPKSSSSNCPDHDHTLTDVGCAKGGRERGIACVVPVRGDEAGKPRPYLSRAVVPSIERGTVLPLAATGHASHVVF